MKTAEERRQYYLDHKEKIAEYNKRYKAAHPDQIKAYKKAYRARHKAQIAAYQREYRKTHPGKSYPTRGKPMPSISIHGISITARERIDDVAYIYDLFFKEY